jgi:hypothetical protein
VPQLPFVVAPTIRTRMVTATVDGQDCSLEFPIYRALKGKEILAIREHEYQSVVYRESSYLADALVAEGIEEAEAQRTAIRIISTRMGIPVALDAAEQRAMLRHASLIADLTCSLQDAFNEQRLRTITAVIAHRLPGCQAWTDDDSGELPGPLQDAIYAFASDEQAGDRPQLTADQLVEDMVETLGKLAPPSAPEEPTPSPSTGQGSTGAADGSGPLPQSSPPADSETSPSTTSTKRSRKVKAG